MPWWLRNKKDGKILVPRVRMCLGDPVTGPRQMGYEHVANLISALKVSGLLVDLGIPLNQCETINQLGYTLDEMKNWKVPDSGYALRHTEGWYWISDTRKVWFRRPEDAVRVWRQHEHRRAVQERNGKLREISKSRLVMVRAVNGEVEPMELYLDG